MHGTSKQPPMDDGVVLVQQWSKLERTQHLCIMVFSTLKEEERIRHSLTYSFFCKNIKMLSNVQMEL